MFLDSVVGKLYIGTIPMIKTTNVLDKLCVGVCVYVLTCIIELVQ